MCEIKEVQAIYSFMKVKGIGVTRTNKELLTYMQQLGSMWKLEDWLLSVCGLIRCWTKAIPSI